MKRVLVRPFYPAFLGNKLFHGAGEVSQRWLEPYARFRELAASRGFEVDTWDLHPWESADVILFQDLPVKRIDILEAKRRAPQARFGLMLVESPLGRPHCFHRANHADFQFVLTYNWRLCDESRYFRYYLPIGSGPAVADPPFANRKPLVMINSNRLLGPLGLFSFRHPGLIGLPAFGWFFSDWKVGFSNWVNLAKGELYSHRRRLARLADAEFPGMLDIYGPGWSGEPTGWVEKLKKPRPFQSARGPAWNKDELLPGYRFGIAFENMTGDVGYISEKIFDTLSAGVVPVYLGDQRIAEQVDPACFIDARNFDGDRELLTFVRDCDEARWRSLRDAGQRFLGSEDARKFQSESFANRMVDVLDCVVR